MRTPSVGIDQGHAGGKQCRENHDRPDRHAVRSLAGGEAEQRHFGRGVEAQAEQETQGQHVPRPRDAIEHRLHHPADEAAALGQAVELVGRQSSAGAQATEGQPQRAQDDQVGDRQRKQQQCRDARSDDAADAAQFLEAFPQHGGARGNARDGQGHHGRMSKGEVETQRERRAAFPAQLAGHRINGGDMVGIDGVTQAKTIGDQRRAEQQRPIAERP